MSTSSRGTTPLGITVLIPSPGMVRFVVGGEVDLATASGLGMRLLAVMDANRPFAIDVDLAGVSFLDCSGISVLVAVRNAAERIGCQIRISRPQPMVVWVFETLGLLGPFTAPVALPEPPPANPSSLVVPRAADATTAGRIAA